MTFVAFTVLVATSLVCHFVCPLQTIHGNNIISLALWRDSKKVPPKSQVSFCEMKQRWVLGILLLRFGSSHSVQMASGTPGSPNGSSAGGLPPKPKLPPLGARRERF